MAPVAAAQADATWNGSSTTSNDWNDATNWTVVAPSTPPASNSSVGVLTFPTLTGCVAPSACYTSHNGLTNVSVSSLILSNNAGQYRILGNALRLTGGITEQGGNTGTGTGNDVINTPLNLSGTQNWLIGNGFGTAYNSLSLANTATVTGSVPLSVTFPTAGTGTAVGGDLYVGGDMEVSSLAVSGAGGLHIGPSTGSVNGSTGNPVGLSGKATLIANPGAKVGAVTSTGGQLQVGTASGTTGATATLAVNGGVSLDSNTNTTTFINGNGSAAGTDFSQLSATGDLGLNGALKVVQGSGNGGCAVLSRGDAFTLFTTMGTITSTFANAPEGTVLTMTSCQGTAPQVQIHYTTNSVIATVVNGTTPTTTTLETPNPSPASTNQKVTLTAVVTTNTNSTVAPVGTMAFSANGATIPGCGSQPLTVSGSSAQATCSASFAAADSPLSLTATFNGASGSGQATSTSPAQSLTVNKGMTKTKLDASNASPAAGGSVTYTATVTPDVSGATNPSGKVRFMDGGNAISGCDGQPLTGGKATCTVTYPGAGSHTITAAYGGDSNFTGSTSSATTVTVTSSPSPPPPPPPPPAPSKSKGKLLGPGGRLTVIDGRTRFAVKCQSKVLCRGSFSFTAKVRGKNKKFVTVTCASGSFRIRAGRSLTLRVRLSKACLRLLRAQRHHRLTVLYTSRSSTGQMGQRKRITLVLK